MDTGYRKQIARRLRDNAGEDPSWLVPWAVFNDGDDHFPVDVANALADAIDPVGQEAAASGDQAKSDRIERARSTTPKILDADGVECRIGDTVWDSMPLSGYKEFIIADMGVGDDGPWLDLDSPDGCLSYGIGNESPSNVTHAKPVIAADGNPIEVGQTVWNKNTGLECVVRRLPREGEYQAVIVDVGKNHHTSFDPEQLTHDRPDSWERIENDMADFMSQQQCGPISPEIAVEHACSFVRRCMALSEKQTRCIPTENDAKGTTMKIRYTKKNGDTFIYDVKDEQITFDQWFYSCLDHCGGFFPIGCGFISKDQIAKVEVVQDAD